MQYNNQKSKNFNPENTIIDYSNKEPLDMNLNSLLEEDRTVHGISTSNDLILISECSNEHEVIKGMYKRKFDSLKVISKWWKEGNLSSVINALKIMKDKIVISDFFNFAFLKNDISTLSITFDICIDIFPLLTKLTQDKYDNYIRVGIATVDKLLKTFSDVLYPELASLSDSDPRKYLQTEKSKKVLYLFSEFRKLPIIDKILSKQYNKELYNLTRDFVDKLEIVLIN